MPFDGLIQTRSVIWVVFRGCCHSQIDVGYSAVNLGSEFFFAEFHRENYSDPSFTDQMQRCETPWFEVFCLRFAIGVRLIFVKRREKNSGPDSWSSGSFNGYRDGVEIVTFISSWVGLDDNAEPSLLGFDSFPLLMVHLNPEKQITNTVKQKEKNLRLKKAAWMQQSGDN